MKKWFDVDAIFKLFLHKALQLEKHKENSSNSIKNEADNENAALMHSHPCGTYKLVYKKLLIMLMNRQMLISD